MDLFHVRFSSCLFNYRVNRHRAEQRDRMAMDLIEAADRDLAATDEEED